MMNETHLNKFLEISVKEHNWAGHKLLDWWSSVFVDQETRLEPTDVSRDELKILCANLEYSDAEVFAAVMAWGGMIRKHGRSVAANIENICNVLSDLRNDKICRDKAYSTFIEMRRSRPQKIIGMGPAYFTKLIFFCSPRHDGYIMDQWTSKSINLIYGDNIVDLYGLGFVSDKNDTQTYVRFCLAVEKLAKIGGWSPEETEIRLFYEGRNKGEWRKYVMEHWSR